MHQKLPFSQNGPRALVKTLAIAAAVIASAGVPLQAHADTLTYQSGSVVIPTGLTPGTAFEFMFGGFSDSNKAVRASDFTVTPNPFPADSTVSIVAVPASQRAGGAPDFSLSAYFTIAQLAAIGTLTGTITDPAGDTVNISQPVAFGVGGPSTVGLIPLDLTGLTGLLLHIPIITSALLPVTLIDPLGHSVVDLVPVVLGQITLPLTGPVPGVYTAKYSIGGKDYVTQRDVAVPEPAMSWIFGPGLLALVAARPCRRVLRRTSFGLRSLDN